MFQESITYVQNIIVFWLMGVAQMIYQGLGTLLYGVRLIFLQSSLKKNVDLFTGRPDLIIIQNTYAAVFGRKKLNLI